LVVADMLIGRARDAKKAARRVVRVEKADQLVGAIDAHREPDDLKDMRVLDCLDAQFGSAADATRS
jgi:hypothetical protein